MIKNEMGCLASDEFKEQCHALAGRLVVITDANIAPILGKSIADFLGAELLVIEAGEIHKTRQTKGWIEDQLFAMGCNRDTCLIAVGGGVVTDIVGFVAATYCRGLPLVLIPSSLLAMVDAAVGGKNGVNLPQGKNMVGTFYPPEAIYIDVSVLKHLPDKEIRNGLAEVIKAGLIADSELFKRLQHWNLGEDLSELIAMSVKVKMDVVDRDPKEKGLRRILNFGHTIGHALESMQGYRLAHGEAVALGMLAEAHLAKFPDYDQVLEIIKKFNFPLKISASITTKKMLEALKKDKKNTAKEVRFVQLEKIGACLPFDGAYVTTFPEDEIKATLDWMLGEFR